MVKCKVCGKEFETERQLHGHLKAHKMRMAEYYQTCFPRHDKHTGELIKFKSKDYYFENDFNSRTNLRLWPKDQEKEVAQEYCKGLLKTRKEKKNLIFAPTQVELRTLMMPAIQVYDALFGDYYKVCQELDLIVKHEKQKDEYDFELNADAIKDRFKIYIDTREQKPLKFNVKTEIKNLKFGDYAFSHPGYSQNCYIERKSVSDFVGTLSGGFKRFVNEIERAGFSIQDFKFIETKNLGKTEYLPTITCSLRKPKEKINIDQIIGKLFNSI